MKCEEIPEKCQNCYHMRTWSLSMDGNHKYSCRKKPSSVVGKEDCDCFEEIEVRDGCNHKRH